MLPYLEIAGVRIPMYSLMIIIGVIFGGLYFFLVTFKEEKFSKLTLKRFFIAIVISAICLIIGAFLFDGLFHSIEEGELVFNGITWLGGVVVGFPAFVLLTNALIPEAKGKALKFVSLIIPSIVLAHAFGRIGCFFGGCCCGKVTDSIFGVQFPFLEEKVLPTQLFESIFDFILFGAMAILRKRIKYHNFEIYFIVYGIFRFFNEFLRGDDRGATSSVLSPAQLLSISIIIAGIIILSKYAISKNINKQLSVTRRIDCALLFASKEEYKLRLSWRNGALILTSLVLVLFFFPVACSLIEVFSLARIYLSESSFKMAFDEDPTTNSSSFFKFIFFLTSASALFLITLTLFSKSISLITLYPPFGRHKQIIKMIIASKIAPPIDENMIAFFFILLPPKYRK